MIYGISWGGEGKLLEETGSDAHQKLPK